MKWEVQTKTLDARTGEYTVETTWEDIPAAVVAGMIEDALQGLVDATARARGYRTGDACASYAGSSVAAWAAEAAAFIAWRDAVWTYAFGLMDNPPETIEAAVEGAPAMEWP